MKKNATAKKKKMIATRLNDTEFTLSEIVKAVELLSDNLANVSGVMMPLVAANDLLIKKGILEAKEIEDKLTELRETVIDEGKA